MHDYRFLTLFGGV